MFVVFVWCIYVCGIDVVCLWCVWGDCVLWQSWFLYRICIVFVWCMCICMCGKRVVCVEYVVCICRSVYIINGVYIWNMWVVVCVYTECGICMIMVVESMVCI